MPSVLPASSAPEEAQVIAPAAVLDRAVRLHRVARKRDHLAERELRDRGRVAARHVGDPDVVLAGGVDVDPRGIETHPGARHDLEPAAALLHMLPGNPAFAADDRIDRRRFGFPPLGLGPRVDDDELGAAAEPFKHFGLEFLYEDSAEGHGVWRRGRIRTLSGTHRRVQCHGGANERLQRLFINLVALMEIDGTPGVAFEAGVEEA